MSLITLVSIVSAYIPSKLTYSTLISRPRVDSPAIQYYSRILKVEPEVLTPHQLRKLESSGRKVFLARKAISDERPHQAEKIYVDIIDQNLSRPKEEINLPELAATTLLLALQQQRNNDKKAARSTFNNFFKIATEFYSDETTIRTNPSTDHEHEDCICGCGKGCTARVIQAFALFESKNKLRPKSKFLIKRAIEYDRNLESILKWKMFEDVDRQHAIS
ncbi:hypothetical protein TrVE_jg9369 [Triparma verrucosa]|uniref:Uncharacterized protein n=1 Tax=Triparma verrucosa TaxID=1606542 RepID=A0A9W6ZBN4_9STRA|nr:hypothetical protein TrVE_jg9369 [Triparma verrucosa]